jgi:two-component system, sporulation sensor kinase E
MKEYVKKVSTKISKLTDEQLENLIQIINEENDTLDSILESLSDGLVIVDNNFFILQKNKAAERFLSFKNFNEQRNENLPVWEIIGENEIAEYIKSCAEKSVTNVSKEFSIQFLEDKVIFLNVKILPLVQKKQNADFKSMETVIKGSIISLEDITEKRTQEVLLHRMESLSSLTNLAASVAHEIKNPLGAISIHIQLLQKAIKKAREGDGMLPQEKFVENYISVINEEIDNLNKIVLDFLFAVRPVQAKLVLTAPDILLKKFIEFFKPEFEKNNIDTIIKLNADGVRLLIDEKLFREVIVNIAQNSIYAINEKQKNADSSFAGQFVIESKIKNEKYYISIADNGSGMDEKTLERIFEPYYTTKANGTGLGMTTVYKIIKEFNGDVNVKSFVGQGTIFTIQLPLPQTATKLLEHNS